MKPLVRTGLNVPVKSLISTSWLYSCRNDAIPAAVPNTMSPSLGGAAGLDDISFAPAVFRGAQSHPRRQGSLAARRELASVCQNSKSTSRISYSSQKRRVERRPGRGISGGVGSQLPCSEY